MPEDKFTLGIKKRILDQNLSKFEEAFEGIVNQAWEIRRENEKKGDEVLNYLDDKMPNMYKHFGELKKIINNL